MAGEVAVRDGSSLDLECPVEVPSEDIIISWTCNDEPANIRSSRIHITELGKLRIHSAKKGDSCDYRCEAANGFGTISAVIKVIIIDRKGLDVRLSHGASNSTTPTSSQHRSVTSSKNLEDLKVPHEDHDSKAKTSSGIAIQIFPSSIKIGKNQTFSLECRVEHSGQHSIAPQIIWLKELIGHKPESLSEAHEQSLVLIDNVYYHTLNWPKSITYLRRSTSSSSALLVRHANGLHSGRYICFAGYPPSIMASNLTFHPPPSVAESFPGKSSRGPLFDYKIALSVVSVDDDDMRPVLATVDKARTLFGASDIFIGKRGSILLVILFVVLALIGLIYHSLRRTDKPRGGLEADQRKTSDTESCCDQTSTNPEARRSRQNFYNSPEVRTGNDTPDDETAEYDHADSEHLYSEISVNDTVESFTLPDLENESSNVHSIRCNRALPRLP